MVEIDIIGNRMNKIKITNRFEKRHIRFLKEILPSTWDATITKLLNWKLLTSWHFTNKQKKMFIINMFHVNIRNFHNNDRPNKTALIILSLN